jgi:antimicrobial peptide system SdpA family protein
MLFPQGWVFFTKSPKEEMIDVYKKNSKKEYVRVPLNNSSASSYYGLNRFNRLKQLEFDYILMESKKVEWSTLDSLKFHSKLSIYNRTNINTLNGDLLLVKHKPIPWSWRKNQNIQVEKKYKKINVRNVF